MSDPEDSEREQATKPTDDAKTDEATESEETGETGGEEHEDEEPGSEDADPAPSAIPLAEPAPAAPPEIHAVPDPDQERQDRVREKLREMYGDDSAETVRRFLYELTTDEEDEPSN